ncbi:MAG: hypothetical protein GY795_08585, partial [Desulfobacterales bacterium]|nr:hypothetical protein [Desulfobacterales bacterium]
MADKDRLLSSLVYTEKKKLLDLFTSLGTEGFQRFQVRSCWEVDRLENKTHAEALTICEGLFQENIRPIVARFNLFRRVQKKNENFEEFLCALRSIAKDCKFDALNAAQAEEERVVEAAILLMKDEKPRKEILKEDAVPSLENLRQLVTTYETQKKSADQLKNETRLQSAAAAVEIFSDSDSTCSDVEIDDSSGVFMIQSKKYKVRPVGKVFEKIKSHNSNSHRAKPSELDDKCYRCGNFGHKANYYKCPAKGKECQKCHKIGHFKRVCGGNVQKNANMGSITVAATNGEDNRVLVDIWVDPSDSSGPGKVVKFWGDSAAQVATISESDFQNFFGKVKLLTADQELTAMNGTRSKPLGMFRVNAEFKGRKASFMLYVVKNPSLTLLGLREMGILQMTIDTVAHRIASVQESGAKCNASNSASISCDSVNKHAISAQIPSNCDNCISVSISDVSGTMTNSKSEELLNVLKKEYPDVFSKSVGKTPTFEHKILLKPGAEPRRVKMRPIPLKEQDLVTAEIEKNIQEGIFSPCTKSNWNSPLHVVN